MQFRSILFLLILISTSFISSKIYAETATNKESLGRALYFDKNLSLNRTQSCATCHDPLSGFVDKRTYENEKKAVLSGAVSLGDDGKSFGDRSAPTSSYASQIPPFHQNDKGEYIGGQFWDGRASTLSDQAKGPPLNPIEMGAPNKAFIKERLVKNKSYQHLFRSVFGENIFDDENKLYDAMADSIAAFEKTDFFSPFDSKYDRHLRGEYKMTKQEELGMTLFFSEQFTNCNQCHQLKKTPAAAGETFSNYSYHNIGTPINQAVRQQTNSSQDYIDTGLLNHPEVNDVKQKGKFKVPTLRNVAVTGPYMHNGVFKELRTVIDFYNKYNSKSAKRQINPETGKAWQDPEVAETLSMKEIESGPALDDKRINALVAFMLTLTDKRFEHLLNQ